MSNSLNSIILFILLVVLHLHTTPSQSQEPLKVGVISPLSGPYAHFGEAGRAGIELAEKELPNSNLRFLYEDSQFEANQALNASMKLIQVDKVDILIVLGTPTSSAVLPFSSKNNIPTFIWSASGDLSRQYRNSIRLMSTGAEQGDTMAREAVKRNYNKVALVASENGYSQAVIDGVLDSPIIKELDTILDHEIQEHLILIDDAREFTGHGGYPTIDQLHEYILARKPHFRVLAFNDIIRIWNSDGLVFGQNKPKD